MKRQSIKLFLLIIAVLTISSCSSYMYGYTKLSARDQYLKVDEKIHNFGFKRIEYIVGYRGKAIATFLEEKGYPDYIFEYEKEDKEGDKREGFIFFI